MRCIINIHSFPFTVRSYHRKLGSISVQLRNSSATCLNASFKNAFRWGSSLCFQKLFSASYQCNGFSTKNNGNGSDVSSSSKEVHHEKLLQDILSSMSKEKENKDKSKGSEVSQQPFQEQQQPQIRPKNASSDSFISVLKSSQFTKQGKSGSTRSEERMRSKEFRKEGSALLNLHLREPNLDQGQSEFDIRDISLGSSNFLLPNEILPEYNQDQEHFDLRSRKKKCRFCRDGKPYFDTMNVPLLQKFMNQLGRILPRKITGNCLKHQRKVSRTIKKARHMGLFTYKGGSFQAHNPFDGISPMGTLSSMTEKPANISSFTSSMDTSSIPSASSPIMRSASSMVGNIGKTSASLAEELKISDKDRNIE